MRDRKATEPAVVITRTTLQYNYMNALMAWGPTDGSIGPTDPSCTPIDGLRITDVIIRGNNTMANPLVGDVAEYVAKIWGTRGTVIDNIESHENNGPGFWFDTDNSDFYIRNSYFHDNRPVQGSVDEKGKGLFIEVNWAPGLIERNVFIDNAGAGLALDNSQGVEVKNNLFVGNDQCITLVNGDRGTTPSGAPLYPLKNILIHENDCRDWARTGAIAAIYGAFDHPGVMGILADENTYDAVRNTVLASWPEVGAFSTLDAVRSQLGWEANGRIGTVAVP